MRNKARERAVELLDVIFTFRQHVYRREPIPFELALKVDKLLMSLVPERPFRDHVHEYRFYLVHKMLARARRLGLKLTVEEACERVSCIVGRTKSKGKPHTIKKSYQRGQRIVRAQRRRRRGP